MKLNILFYFCLLPEITYAHLIEGRVVDEQSQPMAFANVVLIDCTDSAFVSGTVTKSDGTFAIETDYNDGLLKVSSVGYIIRYINVRQGNVGDIQMHPRHPDAGRSDGERRTSAI